MARFPSHAFKFRFSYEFRYARGVANSYFDNFDLSYLDVANSYFDFLGLSYLDVAYSYFDYFGLSYLDVDN